MPKFIDDLNVAGAVSASADPAKVTNTVQKATGQSVDLAQYLDTDGTTVRGKVDANFIATFVTLVASGLTGATSAARYVGATASGAPASGTFVAGDWVISKADAKIYACTAGGTPGTWTTATAGGLLAANNLSDVANAATARTNLGAAAVEPTTAPPSTNTTGSVLGTGTTAAHSDHTHAIGTHDHSTAAKGGQVTPSTGLAATGTPSSTTYLRGDNTWSTPAGGGGASWPLHRSGGYYPVNTISSSAAAAANGTEYAIPLIIGDSSVTADRIAVEVTTAGNAGAVVRLGIRNDTGRGAPGTVLLDGGTVAADTTGTKELTISQALPAGTYWVTVTAQSAATTAPQLRLGGQQAVKIPLGWGTSVASTIQEVSGYTQTGVSGALPGTFTVSPAGAAGVPNAWVRFA